MIVEEGKRAEFRQQIITETHYHDGYGWVEELEMSDDGGWRKTKTGG